MITPRPTLQDTSTTRETVETLMPRLVAYLKSVGKFDDDDLTDDFLDDIRRDIMTAITGDDDHKKTCDRLEALDWMIDGKLRTLLKDVPKKRRDVHRKSVKEWVRNNNITPQYAVPAIVTFRHSGGSKTGEIVKVEDDTGHYVVMCTELGHVRSGVGIHGIVVAYEDVL